MLSDQSECLIQNYQKRRISSVVYQGWWMSKRKKNSWVSEDDTYYIVSKFYFDTAVSFDLNEEKLSFLSVNSDPELSIPYLFLFYTIIYYTFWLWVLGSIEYYAVWNAETHSELSFVHQDCVTKILSKIYQICDCRLWDIMKKVCEFYDQK